MVRACHVLFSANLGRARVNAQDALKAASALEIIHSSLLVHDDIMDRDLLRRGEKTIFAQYQELAEREGLGDTYHFGESLGVCVGDIGFFLAFKLLSELSVDSRTKNKIIENFVKDIVLVGLAQMQDVYLGYLPNQPQEIEVMKVHRYKTARYTFSLPFEVGARLAQLDDKVIEKLSELGEYLGIIFQIKDDEMGIFGTEEEIRKPAGSDVKENKKTLFSIYLFNESNEQEKTFLKSVFGSQHLTKEQLQEIRAMIEVKGIRVKVLKEVEAYARKAKEIIDVIGISEVDKQTLRDLLDYNCGRVV